MGLDIQLGFENADGVESYPDYSFAHPLSRDFCTLMCRRDAGYVEEPELDQIGRLTGVDVEVLYRMERFVTRADEEGELERASGAAERERVRAYARQQREALRGNIDGVIGAIEELIAKLTAIDDLPQRLARNQNTRLEVDRYLSNFGEDPGDGYIGNNFGQDLRNLRRTLLVLKEQGARTVFFVYG